MKQTEEVSKPNNERSPECELRPTDFDAHGWESPNQSKKGEVQLIAEVGFQREQHGKTAKWTAFV